MNTNDVVTVVNSNNHDNNNYVVVGDLTVDLVHQL